MEIKIGSCLEGSKSAEGLVVIVDVIRGCSTIVEMLERGVKEVMPVDSLENRKNYTVCSERKVFLPKEADLGNSPYEASKFDFGGRKVMIKTYACTPGILSAKKADEVILGCFLNADAVIGYIKKKRPKLATIVAMGDHAKTKCVEDELFANYLKDRLEGREPDFRAIRKKIIRGSLKNWFRHIFFKKHLEYCLRLNTSKIVPKFVNGKIIAAN